jgi:hypothetical protein
VRSAWRGDDERGSVTAEFATVLPAALLVLALGIGAVQAGGQQIRLIDAAAVDARLIGRGDAPRGPDGSALATARSVERGGGMVCVTLTARSSVIGLGAAGVRVSGRACALDEDAAATERGSAR